MLLTVQGMQRWPHMYTAPEVQATMCFRALLKGFLHHLANQTLPAVRKLTHPTSFSKPTAQCPAQPEPCSMTAA